MMLKGRNGVRYRFNVPSSDGRDCARCFPARTLPRSVPPISPSRTVCSSGWPFGSSPFPPGAAARWEKPRTKIGPVQRVVNHPSDINPLHPSPAAILHLFPGQQTGVPTPPLLPSPRNGGKKGVRYLFWVGRACEACFPSRTFPPLSLPTALSHTACSCGSRTGYSQFLPSLANG